MAAAGRIEEKGEYGVEEVWCEVRYCAGGKEEQQQHRGRWRNAKMGREREEEGNVECVRKEESKSGERSESRKIKL